MSRASVSVHVRSGCQCWTCPSSGARCHLAAKLGISGKRGNCVISCGVEWMAHFIWKPSLHLCTQVSGVNNVSTLVVAPGHRSRAACCRGAGRAAPPRGKLQGRKGVCARERGRPPAVPAGAGEQEPVLSGAFCQVLPGSIAPVFCPDLACHTAVKVL